MERSFPFTKTIFRAMLELNLKFNQLFGDGSEPKCFFCPGRVNLIGEHIDYLGGLVMPAAISLGITGLIRPSDGDRIRLASTSFDDIVEFDLKHLHTEKQGHWSDYVLGVIHSVQNEGIEVGGFDLFLDSTLPKGSGLSSSAAMEVLIHYSLQILFSDSDPDRTALAVACQKIENNFIGVQCGIMDQFAVANGKLNNAMMLDCASLEFKHVPFDLGYYSLVIINSKKSRELTNSAYNKRRQECNAALQLIQNHRPIEYLVHATESDLLLTKDKILKKRIKHAYSEQLRVLASELVLQSGDFKSFGKLLVDSHKSLKDDFQVSCNELDFIVDFLIGFDDCAGARMTGAGFGGCCIALIRNNKANELCHSLSVAYTNKFGYEPEWFVCETSDGVRSIT